jgi:UDP-N-acetylglucosamine 2-epimerase
MVGDVMADALFLAKARMFEASTILTRMGLTGREYLLATIHRAENTDDPQRLENIFSALADTGETVVFPIHPRTRVALDRIKHLSKSPNILLTDPVSYLDMVQLEAEARMILTDSGGIQKEAYWLGVPCVTLRNETEWVETVGADWNRLAGSDPDLIIDLVKSFTPPSTHPPLYGDGHAAERCVALLY